MSEEKKYHYGPILPSGTHLGRIFGLEREIVLPFSGKTIKTITEVYEYIDDDWVKIDEMFQIKMSELKRRYPKPKYNTSEQKKIEEEEK